MNRAQRLVITFSVLGLLLAVIFPLWRSSGSNNSLGRRFFLPPYYVNGYIDYYELITEIGIIVVIALLLLWVFKKPKNN